MFLKFWIISTVICVLTFASVEIPIEIETKKKFTREEIRKYKYWNKKNVWAWYSYVFLFACPVINILFVVISGFCIQETKEKVFKDIRKANGKQTVSDAVSDALEKVLRNHKENEE